MYIKPKKSIRDSFVKHDKIPDLGRSPGRSPEKMLEIHGHKEIILGPLQPCVTSAELGTQAPWKPAFSVGFVEWEDGTNIQFGGALVWSIPEYHEVVPLFAKLCETPAVKRLNLQSCCLDPCLLLEKWQEET